MYIYLDESGDLGFDFRKKGTSKHFIITVLLTREPMEDFNFYLGLKLFMAGQMDKKLKIIHVDSQKDRCIQAVDFVSGSVFCKYEVCSLNLYSLIKGKIISEVFWPK